MAYLDEDLPYQKIWFELQALAWNRPELQERLARVHAEWRAVLVEAFAPVREELGLDAAARGAGHARLHVQRGDHARRDSRGSRPDTASSSTGSTAGSRGERDDRRADRAAAREQTRARYPDESGYVERDGVRALLRGLRLGRADGLPPADVVDHPLAPLEDADPVPRAALPRAARSTGAATAARTGRRSPTRTARSEFAADALAVMDATGTERAVLVSLSRGAERSLLLAASTRSGSTERSSSRRPCRCRRRRRA